MRKITKFALSGALVLLAANPSTALQGALEATWSDSTTLTVISESCSTSNSAPTPYDAYCTFTARGDSLAAPFRGQCTESISTIGSRRLLGPCRAVMTVTMAVNRVRADRQSPAVYTCNGTTLDQQTPGPEPVPLKGTFTYTNSDGLVRTVQVDVTVISNVVKFAGSRIRIDTEEILDEVDGRFPVRCANTSSSGGYSGQYNFVA